MDFHDKLRRARRRDRTLVIAKRRRDEHLSRNHYNDTTGLTEVDCVCELSNTMFSKRTAFGCGCRKRHHGRPKVANGLCKIGAREHIIKDRQKARKLANDAIMGRGYEEEPERVWAKGKPEPKLYTIEKRRIRRNGEPEPWYTEMRKYRTKADQSNALWGLRKGARYYHYDIRMYRQGAEGLYRGPIYEFRRGPDPGSDQAAAA